VRSHSGLNGYDQLRRVQEMKIRKHLSVTLYENSLTCSFLALSVPVGLPLWKFCVMIFRSLPSPSTSTCSIFVWFVLNVGPRHQGNDGKKEDDTQAGRQAGRQTVVYKEACFVFGTGMSETLGGIHHNNSHGY